MNKTILLFTTTLFILFISGCAQKVNMRALEPAEIDRAAATKKIAVDSFSNDRVGLSGKIEAKLARFKIDNKSYFTIVSRNDFKKIPTMPPEENLFPKRIIWLLLIANKLPVVTTKRIPPVMVKTIALEGWPRKK